MVSSLHPGITYPTRTAMSSGTARASAFADAQNANKSQVMANKMAAGGKMKKKYHGGAIVAPQIPLSYKPVGGVGTDPNAQIASHSQTSVQSHANKVYDDQATKMGGYRKNKTTKRAKRTRKSNKTKGRKNKSKSRKTKRRRY